DQGKHQSLVLTKELAHFLAVLRLRRLCLGHSARVEKVAINLPVQVVAIRDHHESKIAGLFAEDFPDIEDHREALTGTLRMPEHAELAVQVSPLQESFVGPVYTDELVILGNNLVGIFVIKDEVFDVIEQFAPGKQAFNDALEASALFGYLSTINFFVFIFGPEPGKKVLPVRAEASDPCFNSIRQHAERVRQV